MEQIIALPVVVGGAVPRLTLVPIIQSFAQLEKNYGKEGAEIIMDNVQDTISPNSRTAEVLSKALCSRTVLSDSVSQGKESASKSLQMMERALLTPDELKSLPKGTFIVMKTGTHPMRTRLRLSRSTVQRALNDLYRAGFLEKQNRRRPNGSLTSNLFTVK